VIERPQPGRSGLYWRAVSEKRASDFSGFLWLIVLLLLGSATQCRANEPPAVTDGTAPATPAASPFDEPTATPPPSPTMPTAATSQAGAPTDVLTTTATITATIASEAVATGTATAEPSPTPIIYVIEEGDTLLALAIDWGTTVKEILALNPGLQPALLQIGQQVILPPRTAAPGAVRVPDDLPDGVSVAGVWPYANPAGGWWLLGEVVNDSEQPVENVQLTVNLLDNAGNVLQSHPAWATNSVIRPGGRSPFGVLAVEAPADFDHAAAMITAGNGVSDLGSRYLDLVATETKLIEEEGINRLSGQVQNEGAANAAAVAVVVTLYDDAGQVTGYVQQRLEGSLAPGASIPFSLDVVPPGGMVDHYDISAEGVRD
jgi:LysM repeat protein